MSLVVPHCKKQSCYVSLQGSFILMFPVFVFLECFSKYWHSCTSLKNFVWVFVSWQTCIVAVQSLNRVQLFAIPLTAACQTSLSFTVSQSWLKCVSIELVMPSNHLVLCPLSPSSPLALNLSQHQGLFQWVGIPMLCNMAKKKKFFFKR